MSLHWAHEVGNMQDFNKSASSQPLLEFKKLLNGEKKFFNIFVVKNTAFQTLENLLLLKLSL